MARGRWHPETIVTETAEEGRSEPLRTGQAVHPTVGPPQIGNWGASRKEHGGGGVLKGPQDFGKQRETQPDWEQSAGNSAGLAGVLSGCPKVTSRVRLC